MKLHSSRAVAALFIVAFGLPSVVNAAVTNISDGRIVSIDGIAGDLTGDDNYSHSAVPPTPFAPFDEHLSDAAHWSSGFLGGNADIAGAASQTSSISPSLYSGSGDASLNFSFSGIDFISGTSESIFDIHFSIDSPYVYNFTGNIASAINGLSAYANTQAFLSTGTGTVIQYFEGNDIFDVSGMLEPGAYTLYGKAVVGEFISTLSPSNGTASFNLALAINPVPEPETYAMFLAGLGLVGVVARRKK